jgi:hypothetical protein
MNRKVASQRRRRNEFGFGGPNKQTSGCFCDGPQSVWQKEQCGMFL